MIQILRVHGFFLLFCDAFRHFSIATMRLVWASVTMIFKNILFFFLSVSGFLFTLLPQVGEYSLPVAVIPGQRPGFLYVATIVALQGLQGHKFYFRKLNSIY